MRMLSSTLLKLRPAAARALGKRRIRLHAARSATLPWHASPHSAYLAKEKGPKQHARGSPSAAVQAAAGARYQMTDLGSLLESLANFDLHMDWQAKQLVALM